MAAHDISSKDCSAKPILRIVRFLDGFLFRLERNYDYKGTEYLLLDYLDVIVGGCEDGRLNKVALFRQAGLCPSVNKICALGLCRFDVRKDLLLCSLVYLRRVVGIRVELAADIGVLLGVLLERLQELLPNCILDV